MSYLAAVVIETEEGGMNGARTWGLCVRTCDLPDGAVAELSVRSKPLWQHFPAEGTAGCIRSVVMLGKGLLGGGNRAGDLDPWTSTRPIGARSRLSRL